MDDSRNETETRPVTGGGPFQGDVAEAVDPRFRRHMAPGLGRLQDGNPNAYGGEKAMDKDYRGPEQGMAGRPTIRGHVLSRLQKATHVQHEVSMEAEAAARAYKLLELHPEMGELIDALITLRILRGGTL